MKQQFSNRDGKRVVFDMVRAIQTNKDLLSEVDGLIGDGDHGMNMNKGVTLFEQRFSDADVGFSESLNELGLVLFNEIGGSMGPIYGTIFMEMADAAGGAEEIDLPMLSAMLDAGREGLYDIVEARVGDKTLVDTLAPACDALREAADADTDFSEALAQARVAAIAGKDSTKELAARYGRSSRLGERSRGVLDAGAVSCCLLLTSMFDGIAALLAT